MHINFDQQPFSNIPSRLRAWFQDVTDRAEADPTLPISRVPLPGGSTMDDAIAVSECILALFPRCREEQSTPVDVEFVL